MKRSFLSEKDSSSILVIKKFQWNTNYTQVSCSLVPFSLYLFVVCMLIAHTLCITKNDTSVISSDTKTTEIVTKGNNTISIFNKCCDDDKLFDVVGKRCVHVKNYLNETTKFHEQKVYIGE